VTRSLKPPYWSDRRLRLVILWAGTRHLPGLSEWAVHPGLGDLASRKIDDGWIVRSTDLECLTSPEARDAVHREGIKIIDHSGSRSVWSRRWPQAWLTGKRAKSPCSAKRPIRQCQPPQHWRIDPAYASCRQSSSSARGNNNPLRRNPRSSLQTLLQWKVMKYQSIFGFLDFIGRE
jgi:hypothetical protein